MLLYAGIASRLGFKYSLFNDIVKKLKPWSQSAGNTFILKSGTSETIRNNTEIIKNIAIHVPTHLKPLNDEQFGHYLAGLIDGDGHFSSKQQLVIVFSSPDVKLAYYIKEIIGFGNVKKIKDKNAYLYIISNKPGIVRVINLINGKLRTLNKFHQVINNILAYPVYTEENVNFKINQSNDFYNHWIAGFSDAAHNTATLNIASPLNYSNRKIRDLNKGHISYSNYTKNKHSVPQISQEKSLVVWGQNLTSSVGKGRFTKIVSDIIQLTSYNKDIVVGLLLSDGWITSTSISNKNSRLGFKQSLSHSSYVWFVFFLLSHYCSSYPIFISTKTKDTPTYALQIFTRTLPCFSEIRSLFYVNNIKIVPEDIYNLLTPVALAHLIMGDGNADKHGLILCTDSYSMKDVVRLANVLMVKYRLDCSVYVKASMYPRIYIKAKSMSLLRTLVTQHMSSGMLYKLGYPKDGKDKSGRISTPYNNQTKTLTQNIGSDIFQIKFLNNNSLVTSSNSKSNSESMFKLNFELKIEALESNKVIFEQLIKKFGGYLSYDKLNNNYIYSSGSFSSARKIINYFSTYHLQSSKYRDYLKWRKTYCIVQEGSRLCRSQPPKEG